MRAKANKNKPAAAAGKPKSHDKRPPKTSKVQEMDDKDLEQISGGLRNTSTIKMW